MSCWKNRNCNQHYVTETDEKARMERMERHIVKNRVAIDGTLTEIGEKGKGEIKVKMEKS